MANGNGASPGTSQKLEKVVIRFAGDSGDVMQLTGDRFTTEAALFGNDLATLLVQGGHHLVALGSYF